MRLPGFGGPTRAKRPWLAALLAFVVTGLGHVYLRRWVRAFGWIAVAVAAVLLFVPLETVQAVEIGDPTTYPATPYSVTLVLLASAVDAYLLARRHNEAVERERDAAEAVARGDDPSDGEALACPNCGKDLDADLDFCPWCTTELAREGPNGPDPDDAER
ncbi:zinc ribbon domain-containing protein [Halobaculum lipolyticum]|uniref:Zinc ribbon domain-containing protein n=1 Tax=Halobaculum lipolyticum TaxID=3032001 RepID=A0ABD5WAV1_9EURY|nr:zinc ribbon domain-containing protein [Halobaculum sp. DT31]